MDKTKVKKNLDKVTTVLDEEARYYYELNRYSYKIKI